MTSQFYMISSVDYVVIIYDHNITLFFLEGWVWRGLVQPTDGLLPINAFIEFSDPTPTLILQSCPGADVEVMLMDLKSLDSVRKCASEFKSRNQALDLLVRLARISIGFWKRLSSLYLNLLRKFIILMSLYILHISLLYCVPETQTVQSVLIIGNLISCFSCGSGMFISCYSWTSSSKDWSFQD